MQPRLTVGEMARLVGLSKQTLIFYDREGVFRPSMVDPDTGYRYYTADQLAALDTILNLREMGVPLREIRAHMEERTMAGTIALLREQKQEAEKRMAHWAMVARRVARKLQSLEQMESPRPDGGWLRRLPAEALAVEPVGGSRSLLDVDVALKRLLRRASEEGLPHFYQLGDTVSPDDLAAGRFLRFDLAFLPLQGPLRGPGIAEKPAGLYACRCHRGTYETMGRDYAALLERISAAGYRICGPSYEFCILDSLASDTAEEYLTEIQIPVEPAGAREEQEPL